MRHGGRATWIVVMAAWLLAACGAYVRPGDGGESRPDVTLPDGGGCVLPGGRVLAVGESFFDGCNTCSCGPGGLLACTARACPEDVVVPPPPMCSAPDGTPVEVGASWRSPDGCTECFCDMSASLSCARRSDCFDAGPPPPVCFAPDGTPVPLGARVLSRDFCLACTCPMPGGPAACAPSRDPRCFDAGGPTVCRAPDGTAFAVGTTWTSRDRCTSCVCRPDGTTSCASNPGCFADAGVCVDPGGAPVPVGACFANGCLSCCCTAMGLQCTPSGAPGCIDAGGPPPVCNSVAPSAFTVIPRSVMGVPPAATGGTIADGYYTLRDLISYNGSSIGPGGVRYAVQVTRGSMQFVVVAPGSPTVVRANFNYTSGGTLIRLTPTCSDGGMAGPGAGQYSVRPTGFDLFIDSGSAGQVQHMVFSR